MERQEGTNKEHDEKHRKHRSRFGKAIKSWFGRDANDGSIPEPAAVDHVATSQLSQNDTENAASQFSTQHDTEDYSQDPDKLWTQAYETLKSEEPDLIRHYEAHLQKEFGDSTASSGEDGARFQMVSLLKTGLEKTAKSAEVMGNFSEVSGIILSVKDTVGTALQAVPIAAAAWTGICLALNVFVTPIEEMQVNREGIVQVTRTMKWYLSLAPLLLQSNDNLRDEVGDKVQKLQNRLAENIHDLYKTLLEYMVKSICAYHRRTIVGVLRNAIQLDDWSGSLESVKAAETVVTNAASQLGVRQANSFLGLLVSLRLSGAQNEAMRHLSVTNIDAEVESLQSRKGKVLPGSFDWVVQDTSYERLIDWQHSEPCNLLWIRGDAGTGKTMLMMGILEKLKQQQEERFDEHYLSYFFCQGFQERSNSAVAVLKGLLWMLLRQKRSFIQYVQDEFEVLKPSLLDDKITFYLLRNIFFKMLKGGGFPRTTFLIDALDECKDVEPGRRQLLELIQDSLKQSDKLKWLVSSRKWSDINDVLAPGNSKFYSSIELTPANVSNPIRRYVDDKMSSIRSKHLQKLGQNLNPRVEAQLKEKKRILDDVAFLLRTRSNGNFLWVQLAVEQVGKYEPQEMLEKLELVPPDLGAFYSRMLAHIRNLDQFSLYRRVVLVALTSFRPLKLQELAFLADAETVPNLEEIINDCGFLVVRTESRYDMFNVSGQSVGRKDFLVVDVLHKSVKDYLSEFSQSEEFVDLFPRGLSEGHGLTARRSLLGLGDLSKTFFDFARSGSEYTANMFDTDTKISIGYSCLHWVDHLIEVAEDGKDLLLNGKNGEEPPVQAFLKNKCLFWLEALCFAGNFDKALTVMSRLLEHVQVVNPGSELHIMVKDMLAFTWYNRVVIDADSSQIYTSALIFCPRLSLTRKLFSNLEPQWIDLEAHEEPDWESIVSTVAAHAAKLAKMDIQLDKRDFSQQYWLDHIDLRSHDELDELQTTPVEALISPDGITTATLDQDGHLKLWHRATDGKWVFDRIHDSQSDNMVYSASCQTLVTYSLSESSDTIRFWDITKESLRASLHVESHRAVLALPATELIAIVLASDEVLLCDTVTGTVEHKIQAHMNVLEHRGEINPIAFSPDGRTAAISSVQGSERAISIWDTHTGELKHSLKPLAGGLIALIFSADGKRLCSWIFDLQLTFWDVSSGRILSELPREPEVPNGDSLHLLFTPSQSAPDSFEEARVSIKGESHPKSEYYLYGSYIHHNGNPRTLYRGTTAPNKFSLFEHSFKMFRYREVPLSDTVGAWIYWGDKRLIMIHPEYWPFESERPPWVYDIRKSEIVLCHRSGRVAFLSMDHTEISALPLK